MDEVSRSIELVHALIECRDDIFPDCPAKSFGLILCGTSLEMLHKSGDGQFSVGSNPASSEVVSLDAPNVQALLNKFSSRVSSKALRNGVYTRSFLSNARIVSKALLPYFYSFYGYQNEEDEEQRSFKQAILGSSWECMSFVPAAFVEYNGLRYLELFDKRRCIAAAFRYLVSENVGKNNMESTAVLGAMSKLLADDKTNEEEGEAFGGFTMMEYIFRVGLVTRDIKLTSTALRLVVCKGLADPVLIGNGPSLELAMSMTLCRHLEVCNFKTEMYTLKGAWPPRRSKDTEHEWKSDLNDEHNADVEKIKRFFDVKGSRALVLVQGVTNAQGPDNIVLRRHATDEVEQALADNMHNMTLGDKEPRQERVSEKGTDQTLIADFYQDKNVEKAETVDN